MAARSGWRFWPAWPRRLWTPVGPIVALNDGYHAALLLGAGLALATALLAATHLRAPGDAGEKDHGRDDGRREETTTVEVEKRLSAAD